MVRRHSRALVDSMAWSMGLVRVVDLCPLDFYREASPGLRVRSHTRTPLTRRLPMP
jgi:hypothetical protein